MRVQLRADALAVGVPRLVRAGAASVILLRLPETIIAWRNRCPHMGVELDWREERLVAPGGAHLRCTVHGALFSPRNGICLRGPCVGEHLMPVDLDIDETMVRFDA